MRNFLATTATFLLTLAIAVNVGVFLSAMALNSTFTAEWRQAIADAVRAAH